MRRTFFGALNKDTSFKRPTAFHSSRVLGARAGDALAFDRAFIFLAEIFGASSPLQGQATGLSTCYSVMRRRRGGGGRFFGASFAWRLDAWPEGDRDQNCMEIKEDTRRSEETLSSLPPSKTKPDTSEARMFPSQPPGELTVIYRFGETHSCWCKSLSRPSHKVA